MGGQIRNALRLPEINDRIQVVSLVTLPETVAEIGAARHTVNQGRIAACGVLR